MTDLTRSAQDVSQPGAKAPQEGAQASSNDPAPQVASAAGAVDIRTTVAAFLEYCATEVRASDHTVRAYDSDLTQFIGFVVGQSATEPRSSGRVPVTAVDAHVVRLWLTDLVSRGLARSSIARKVSAVRSWAGFVLRQGWAEVDPTGVVQPPKRGTSLPQVPSQDRMATGLAQLQDQVQSDWSPVAVRNLAVAELLYATGLRVSELAGIDIADLDRSAGLVTVLGKGNKERRVPCGKPALAAVDAYLVRARPLLVQDHSGQALFLGAKGGRLGVRQIRALIATVFGAGTEKNRSVGPHALRHAAATHMLDGGADLRTVQEMLGHANLTSTQIYTQVSIDRLRVTYHQSHPRA